MSLTFNNLANNHSTRNSDYQTSLDPNTSTKVKEVNFKLTKNQKILHKSQFAKVFNTKNPFRYSNKYFQLLAIRNNLDFARVGIVASKKQLKRAHERNRAKRLIREQFRLQQHQFTSLDFIVMPRKIFEQTENSELVEQLTKAFKTMNNFFS